MTSLGRREVALLLSHSEHTSMVATADKLARRGLAVVVSRYLRWYAPKRWRPGVRFVLTEAGRALRNELLKEGEREYVARL